MKIDVVAWGDEIRGLSFKSGDKEGKIVARAFRYSEPVNYNGSRILKIHKSGNGGETVERTVTEEDKEHESVPLQIVREKNDGDDSPVPKELAKLREEDPTLVSLVALPASARRVTVLLAPAAEGTYKGYVINDDPSKLPVGRLRVHNLSPHTIAMQFSGGAGQKTMKSGDTVLVPAPQGHVAYRLAYEQGGEWAVQENNMIPVMPDEQTQMIVLRSDNQFFLSSDGASGGYLQTVTLSRRLE